MIDVSELMDDPDLSQAFQIKRRAGGFLNEGRWISGAETILDRVGIIQPSKAADVLQFLPEGERSNTVITIHSKQDILMAKSSGQESDVVIWNGRQYRVAYSKPWELYGYWFAMAVGFGND